MRRSLLMLSVLLLVASGAVAQDAVEVDPVGCKKAAEAAESPRQGPLFAPYSVQVGSHWCSLPARNSFSECKLRDDPIFG